MLELIHVSHEGIVKCRQRGRDILFRPGISSQIEEKVSQCSLCAQFQRAQPREPMIIQDLPDRMWSKVGTDLFGYNGDHHLLCVDYYSKWIEVAKLDNLTSGNIICHLKSQFVRYGIPDELISDNGPQYASSAFTDFSKSYGFVHTTSSPRFPQTNGEAEGAVQTIKNLLKKAQDPYKGLLNYRNTPLDGITFSPAQLLMDRRLKSSQPTKVDLLKPQHHKKFSSTFKRESRERSPIMTNTVGKSCPPLLQVRRCQCIMRMNGSKLQL